MNGVLVAEDLLQAAVCDTNLDNFGDESFAERFAMAVDILRDAGMDAAGQQAAADVCHWLLTSRLHFFDDHETWSLAGELIEQPVFATGEPRSGTTLLHALLSVDPDSRPLRFWQVMYPSPPPGLAPADDPRRARADNDWRDILERLPKWLVSHPYNDMLGNGLPECERTWAFDFRVMTPTAWWRVPMGMSVGALPADSEAQYRIHKMMLQHCQHGRVKKRWALKGFHGPRLKELFASYPDARVIWTHRDPVQVTASRIALLAELIEDLVGHVDWEQQAEVQLAATRAGFNNTLNNPWIDDPRIYHVRYPDFVTDPVGTIAGFYEYCGLSMSAAADRAMRDYLANNKSDRYGKFEYSTDLIRTDVAALHEEFTPYRERFGLDIEQR
ncbi:MAG: sulfotransferase [Halieaceae bacterium]|nr:sulfotransferase [Halieaceae bacterium]